MSAAPRRLLWVFLASVLLAGCSPTVREDRSITFTPDGQQVVFQHGREGIFLVETEGGTPTKIFQPDADVIATSTPLWSPTDKRLLFTTAKKADKDQHGEPAAPREQDPAGNLHAAQPTVYTCWLRLEPKAGQPLPVPLFTAHCDHPGYVAANLAVRWHPDGRHILFVQQTADGQHGLFEYDLEAKKSRQVFAHTGGALVFDWSPDKTHLVCLLGSDKGAAPTDGIWIGKPGADDWWHISGSEELAVGEGFAALERLRATRPVWDRDGNRFAFVTGRTSEDRKSAEHRLFLGTLATREVEKAAEGTTPFRDLHWRPDGARLGFVYGEESGELRLATPGEKGTRAAGLKTIRAFLGWDGKGEQFAVIVTEHPAGRPGAEWAFLFVPDARARDAVLVAADADAAKARTVFSGMQVTFPQWSPGEAKLSLWATFRPPYRSWLSHLLDLNATPDDPLRGLTLRPGDPALVLDPASGAENWKAIDAHEKMQVGHYHMLKHRYADAWKWYEKAGAQAPAPAERSPEQFVKRFVRGHDALFFQAICLDKLGRHDEARAKRRQFEETFLPDLSAPSPSPPTPLPHRGEGRVAPFGAAGLRPSKEQLLHWRDLYVAEVFLSLDAVEDSETFFRDALQAAASDADRLSKAVVLSQMLLLRHKYSEYAELVSQTVLPLLLKTWKPRPTARAQAGNPTPLNNLLLAYGDGLSLLPLCAPEFLKDLSDRQVRDLLRRWLQLRADADDDVKRLGIDLLVEAAAGRVGQFDEQKAAARRIAANPARTEFLGDKGVKELIQAVREFQAALEWARRVMGKG